METLLNSINPVLRYIDSGKFFREPFKWVYYILGVLNVIIPYKLIAMISEYGRYLDGKYMTCLVLLTIISIPFAFYGAMLWIKRGNELKRDAGDGSRFIAIPIVANFVQTSGEWLGYLMGVGGFITALMLLLFGGRELGYFLPMDVNPLSLIAFPICGFLIVVFARFIAESFLALASIANNTQSIDSELKQRVVTPQEETVKIIEDINIHTDTED